MAASSIAYLTNEAQDFLVVDESVNKDCVDRTKAFFERAGNDSQNSCKLYVEGFDHEQIWSQILPRSSSLFGNAFEQIKSILPHDDEDGSPFHEKTSHDDMDITEANENITTSHDDMLDQGDDISQTSSTRPHVDSDGGESEKISSDEDSKETEISYQETFKKNGETSSVKETSTNSENTQKQQEDDGGADDDTADDRFFSMGNMEKFSENLDEMMDKLQHQDDEDAAEDVDEFGDGEDFSDEEETDLMNFMSPNNDTLKYEDFFGTSYTFRDDNNNSEDVDEDEMFRRHEIDEDDFEEVVGLEEDEFDDEDDNNNDEKVEDDDKNVQKTPHQHRQDKLKKWISELEDLNLADRSWDLMGEASAKQRPKDSLLETFLDFERSGTIQPEITQEVTQDLEEILTQRILDDHFDDVERKLEPKEKPFKRPIEVSQEKSEIGLAEIYEKEYLEKNSEISAEKDEKLEEEHKEIASLFSEVCYQLDSLSNFHFTPKPPRDEIHPKTNLPAIMMEEQLPIGVSHAQTSAPEEVHRPKQKGEIAGKQELTSNERKRKRRKNKRKDKRKKQKEDELLKQKTANSSSRTIDPYDKKHVHFADTRNQEREKRQMVDALAKLKGRKHANDSGQVDLTNYSRSSEVFAKIQKTISKSG